MFHPCFYVYGVYKCVHDGCVFRACLYVYCAYKCAYDGCTCSGHVSMRMVCVSVHVMGVCVQDMSLCACED